MKQVNERLFALKNFKKGLKIPPTERRKYILANVSLDMSWLLMRMYLALLVIERCFLGSSSRKYFSRAWNGSRARTTAGTRDNHLLSTCLRICVELSPILAVQTQSLLCVLQIVLTTSADQ